MIRWLDGLAELADSYDAFIIDLWGVLHDGTTAYAGAADALAGLRRAGKRTLLLSNAPRRAHTLAVHMEGLGIARGLYGELLSSGEAVHRALARRADPFFAALGRRLYHLGPDYDAGVFAGLDYVEAGIDSADFIIATGSWQPTHTVEDFMPVLERGIARALPLVCCNPDLVAIREGREMLCAGAIAARYAAMGGAVGWRGKPDPAIYDEALAILATEPARTVCIGDGMPTDIKGAAAAGLDAVLVTRGIHAEEMGLARDSTDRPAVGRVEALAARFGLAPMAAMAACKW